MAGLRARNESLRAENVEARQVADENRNDSTEFILVQSADAFSTLHELSAMNRSLRWVARATRPSPVGDLADRNEKGATVHMNACAVSSSCPFRPASRRTVQASDLCYPLAGVIRPLV